MIVDGRYRVLKTITDTDDHAEYLTEHQLIGRRLVVKLLHGQAASRPERVARFVAEAEAAGKLRHPNIVESVDMGFVDDRPFVVFEHLHGTRVAEEIERLGRLPVRRAVHVARQVAAALGAAHLEDILHGGLDSDRVFLIDRETDPDFVKVLGLGQGVAGATPEALAPEQVLGGEVDHRTDVWAVGVLLYEMIVGRRPFSADAGSATARRRIVSAEPPAIDRRDVPAALVDVIATCLAKQPSQRYQDMAELDAALAPLDARLARGSSTTIPPAPLLPRLRRPSSLEAAVATPARTSSLIATRTPSAIDLDTDLPRPVRTPAPVAPVAPPRRVRGGLIAGLAASIAVCTAGIYLAITRGTERAPAAPPSPGVTAPLAAIDPAAAAATARVEQATDVEFAVDADAPGARVTFRRRVHAAPVAIAVAPADMVELVEVSAPGRRTVRYWITIDRPTRIRARLVAGDGLVEATEVDTLIALGEASEPAVEETPAPRAAKADRDRDRDRDRARKAQRRSVGRKAAAAAADTPAQPAAEATEPSGEAPADAEARPTADAPATAAPAPAPAPTAARTAPRQVAAGFLESNRIAGNAQILPDNGTRQAMRHQGATRVVGKFKVCVSAEGAVDKVSMVRTSGYDGYDKTIMAELRRWKFKPIAINGEAATVCSSIAIAYSQQ